MDTQSIAQDATVVVAMSGGVDSSLAAALLVERGYNCIGVMMRLWSELRPGESSANKCCSLDSVDDARWVADKLGIPFYLINVEKPFKQLVVDPFITQYAGWTHAQSMHRMQSPYPLRLFAQLRAPAGCGFSGHGPLRAPAPPTRRTHPPAEGRG